MLEGRRLHDLKYYAGGSFLALVRPEEQVDIFSIT